MITSPQIGSFAIVDNPTGKAVMYNGCIVQITSTDHFGALTKVSIEESKKVGLSDLGRSRTAYFWYEEISPFYPEYVEEGNWE